MNTPSLLIALAGLAASCLSARLEAQDIVYIDLPDTDSPIEADAEIGEIESTKATSSVISPVSGTIVKVNSDLEDAPETINEDPYEEGWMIQVEPSNLKDLDDLLTARKTLWDMP